MPGVMARQRPFLGEETVFEFVAPAGAELPRGGRSSGHAAQENQVVRTIDFGPQATYCTLVSRMLE